MVIPDSVAVPSSRKPGSAPDESGGLDESGL
jgi:hypothetical protein